MEPKKIIFFEVGETEEASLRAELAKKPDLKSLNVTFTSKKLTAETLELASDAAIVSVFINSIVNKEIIDGLKSAKLITTRSTGFDHIDREYAAEKGITITNVPSYGSRTVAEFTFALILGLSRKILDASYRTKSGQKFEVSGLMGFDLFGKTIGIIGTGRIGQNVAKIAKGFGMNVIAYDPFQNKEVAASIGFSYVALNDLLSGSDIVTLHVPANKDTYHLVNKETIKLFKSGSLLINTARGEICDSEAILYGIENRILSGAGLDVVEGERTLKDSGRLEAYEKLLTKPEVFITPHLAYYSTEAQTEISRVTADNISAFLNGTPNNLVA